MPHRPSPQATQTPSPQPGSPDRSSSPGALAGALLLDVQELAERADVDDLTYIAWRTAKLANDLCFLASAAGAAQRSRLAAQPEAG